MLIKLFQLISGVRDDSAHAQPGSAYDHTCVIAQISQHCMRVAKDSLPGWGAASTKDFKTPVTYSCRTSVKLICRRHEHHWTTCTSKLLYPWQRGVQCQERYRLRSSARVQEGTCPVKSTFTGSKQEDTHDFLPSSIASNPYDGLTITIQPCVQCLPIQQSIEWTQY